MGQVEALRKVKGKGKKVFSRPPLQTRSGGRGGASPTIEAMVREGLQARARPIKKPLKWQLTFQEPKAQIVEEPKAPISACNAVNTKCVNCQSYNAKTACFGFHSGTKTCEQSTGGRKNVSLC